LAGDNQFPIIIAAAADLQPQSKRFDGGHDGLYPMTTFLQLSQLEQRPSIGRLLQACAERYSERSPIIAERGAALSFGRLFLQAGEVVRALNSFGIGRNDRVAAILPNGPEMAAAFLTIASGAAFAPLNPGYRASELRFFLADLKPKALLVRAGTASPAISVARDLAIPIIELAATETNEAGRLNLTGQERFHSCCEGFAEPDDVALVLHTSGTTSRPKQVALTHRQVTSSAANIAASLQLTPADRCLNVMPLFHIHGLIGALVASVSAGGSVVCTPGFDAENFCVWMNEHRPTWYTAVPTIHQAILAAANADPGAFRDHSLRFIRSCSATLPAVVAHDLEKLFRVPVIEAYGMTEATHQIASNPLPPRSRKPGSVGLPTGAEVAVIDGDRRLAPGELGEIVVRGASVIEQYASDAPAHGSSFWGGWLRTGDRGFLDEDGYLHLSGRLKEIINRGGEKISPAEVDEVLLSHPEIAQAAVFRMPHATLGEVGGAAIIPRPGSKLSEPTIREYLLDRIAAFKIPEAFFIVDEIPKGASGKINRAQLSERFAPSPDTLPAGVDNGEQCHLEASLLRIYREVLGDETIGPADNFFARGGDSLRAAQVINRVRKLLQVNLSIATIFRKPTAAELALEVARSRRDTTARSFDRSTSRGAMALKEDN
jgi:acyl-CoA synthetase (AMP-forming)/AMP-acid ligase II